MLDCAFYEKCYILTEPPGIYSRRKTSFSTLDEYVTVIGFGNIAEEEVRRNQATAMNDVHTILRLVSIPSAGNRKDYPKLSSEPGSQNTQNHHCFMILTTPQTASNQLFSHAAYDVSNPILDLAGEQTGNVQMV